MKTPLRVLDGSQFEAPVIPGGPLKPPAEKRKPDLRDDRMGLLTSLRDNVRKDSAEDQALVAWVLERIEANRFADELLEKLQAVAGDKLVAEWEDAKARVREQLLKIDRHKQQIARETMELNRLSDIRGKKQADFDVAQAAKRQLGRYAAQRDIAEASLFLFKCEAELEYANQQVAAVQTTINDMTLSKLKPLAEKLNELEAEEARLAHAVTGQSYTTPEGIVVPPRAPLR